MHGIYLLFGPSNERFFASKSHFARHFLSGRFQHFCMAANHSTDPYRYKNVKWPILYIYRHSAFLHLLWFADGSSSYVKMQGIYLLLKTLLRTTPASKSFFARHFLSGRFLHFCMAANLFFCPHRYKNAKWPILFIYISSE